MGSNRAFEAVSLAAAVRVVGRYGLYTIFIGVMSVWLLELIRVEAADEEALEALEAASRIWWLQCVLPGATALILAAGAWQASRGRAWLLLGSLLCGMALVRELDERWAGLPVTGWGGPMVLLALTAGLTLAWALRRSGGRDLAVLSSAAPGILWAGGLLVVVFAPIAGQTEAWQALMGHRDAGDLEWAIAALVRTLGYMLIWLGGVELVLEATRPERVDRLTEPE